MNGSKWPVIRDALAFLLGVFILLWQTVQRDASDVTLVIVGFACLGITGSGIATRFIENHVTRPPLPEPGSPPRGPSA
ncbi:MAG TPA: hypothetical protein VFF69_03805 [Phycisphaerales bacterium]|nr:hypothetical protein [Phycisphaerales bacterium]